MASPSAAAALHPLLRRINLRSRAGRYGLKSIPFSGEDSIHRPGRSPTTPQLYTSAQPQATAPEMQGCGIGANLRAICIYGTTNASMSCHGCKATSHGARPQRRGRLRSHGLPPWRHTCKPVAVEERLCLVALHLRSGVPLPKNHSKISDSL
jgi:hypothetical protein